MRIYREISCKIKSLSKEFPALVVTGARQVGKTFLLKEIFPNHNYVSLDTPSTADLASSNPDMFLQKYSPPIVVDEVQYAPELFRHLKLWIDQNRSLKGQVILTGSQKFVLMKEVSDSLAGRVGFIEMEPLSIYELKHDNLINPNEVHSFLERGGFPELWKEKERNHHAFYQAYLNTYIERDVRQIINISNLLDFEKFLRICATRAGQTAVKSEIAKDVGVTVNTIQSWLSVLEASNQVVFLQPFYENFGKRLVKTPKLYFSDTGLLMHLLGLRFDDIIESAMIGPVWENLVFTELRKRLLCLNLQGQLWYYRDNVAREVDFLYVNKGKIHFIESKWTQNPDKKVAQKIEKIANDLRSKVLKKGTTNIIARNLDVMQISSQTKSYSLFDFELP